ncbi:hypothetical protein ACVWWR_004758 [Bradyrhizobium sp. LM3.2]
MNKAVNPNELTSDDDYGPLYAARKKVYPQSISGTFRRIKWGLMAFCLGVYYFLPFVRWNRGLGAPSQAVLVDLPNSRFYFFFIELWPQEVYHFTGLLIVAAVALFLMNSVGGRIWCGYLCPQTVWTDLFYAVERLIEGDRRERMKKDKSSDPMKLERISEIVLKHAIWLLIAWWTGGAWVLYFNDAPTLVKQLVTFQAPMIAYIWVGILTATTYVLAGYMREQVCVYMCPWPRIQAALTDEWARSTSPIAMTVAKSGRRSRRPPSCARSVSTPATALIATSASQSVRPASTSATERSSNASSAGSASMPATT